MFTFLIFSCVIQGLPFFVGVVLPAAIVLIQNFIVLILVTLAILDRKETRSQRRENLASVRIAFACSVLLGTTWAFGIVAVGDLRDIFQWLFCIFNSLQGLFIFIFYAARNAEVRRTWTKFFGLTEFERTSTGFGRTKTRYLNSSGKTGIMVIFFFVHVSLSFNFFDMERNDSNGYFCSLSTT